MALDDVNEGEQRAGLPRDPRSSGKAGLRHGQPIQGNKEMMEHRITLR
jgi:hypothetical protein